LLDSSPGFGDNGDELPIPATPEIHDFPPRMLIQLGLFSLGLVALVLGAEALVRGASRLALGLGVSPLVVGLTIVACGTSAPETAVSVGAALQGSTDIAVGAVVGSNIFNILLILGVSALIVPLVVDAQLIRQEVPILVGVSSLLVLLIRDGVIDRVDAAMLFGLLLAYIVFLVLQSRRQTQATRNEYAEEFSVDTSWQGHWVVHCGWVLLGLALLVVGSRWLVEAAVGFARAFGVSDLVVALTIVATGTSLPEVATSIMAAIRGERDIAVGNVVGSNIFNILGCLGAAGLVAPEGLSVSTVVIERDAWVMLAVAIACLPVFFTGREITRWEGGVFLAYHVAYMIYLVLDATGHAAAAGYALALLGFVLPLTVLTFVVVVARTLRAHRTEG
jgi:cation:H+ antiporter